MQNLKEIIKEISRVIILLVATTGILTLVTVVIFAGVGILTTKEVALIEGYTLKDCHYLDFGRKNPMVCFEEQKDNTLGAYAPGSNTIFISDKSENTIRHECIHFALSRNYMKNMETVKTQHEVIEDVDQCVDGIWALIKK